MDSRSKKGIAETWQYSKGIRNKNKTQPETAIMNIFKNKLNQYINVLRIYLDILIGFTVHQD